MAIDPNYIPQQIGRANRLSYISAVAAIRDGIASASAEMTGPGWQAFLESLRQELIPRTARQAMWERIGTAAQRSLVASYAGRRYRRPIGSYRVGDRYSGGALARALSNPDMVKATAFGLYFINVDRLDREARHWRRLNFGAGAGGAEGIEAPGQFPVTGMGLMIGLEPDPRPSFTMPRGLWLSRGGVRQPPSTDRVGQDAFYLASGSGYEQSGGFGIRADAGRITRGIASRNFLDPPVRLIGARLRPELEGLWDQVRRDNKRSKYIRAKTGRTRLPTRL